MTIDIISNGQTTSYNLGKLASEHQGVINIGRQTKQVWNTIAIDSESLDSFQCTIIGSGDTWRLSHGQERTECPKGLMSDRPIPCSFCMGRCVNIRAGRPRYYQRTPDIPTLVNGMPTDQLGTNLVVGDVITLGDVVIKIK